MCNHHGAVTALDRPAPQTAAGDAGVWRAIFAVHVCLARELDRRLERHHGLSLSALQALSALAAADGRMRMGDLAEAAGLSRSGLTRLADRLEHGGLLSRDRCCDDARGAYAMLTDSGRRRVAEARVTHDEGLAELLLAHLTDAERATITAALDRVLRDGLANCGCGR